MITRSLTLMSFERVSLVEYAYKYEVSISYGSKVIAKVKVFSHRVKDRPKERASTDRTKTIDGPEFHSGGIKSLSSINILKLYLLGWNCDQ